MTENRKKIYYVGMYDILRDGKKIRSYSPAEAKKIDYICDMLTELGYDVELLSASYINEYGRGFVKGSRVCLRNGVALTLSSNWFASNKFSRVFRIVLSLWSLFLNLLTKTSPKDTVLVYHNYHYAIPVILAHKLKKFRLILEIEEEYASIWKLTEWQKMKERLLLKYGTERSLVVSEVLAERLNIKNPVVSYGDYSVYRGLIPAKGMKDEISLVYSGSIDETKGSAYQALELMEYLPSNYRLSLSGYIEQREEAKFFSRLQEVNKKKGYEVCRYLGMLNNNDFQRLLLDADIALNLQKDGEYAKFLFPSKILTYLSYNLDVVTTKGDSIVQSNIADMLHFAPSYDVKDIAQTVTQVDFARVEDYRDNLKKLSAEFKLKFCEVLEGE